MYPATKSNAITEDEARAIVGDKAVDEVLGLNCEFTGRVIDECYEVQEMSASVPCIDADGEDRILTVLYLVNSEDAMAEEDLGNLDYSDYTFTID